MVLLTFTFSNILLLIALAKSVFMYYPQIMTKSSTGDFIRIDACTGQQLSWHFSLILCTLLYQSGISYSAISLLLYLALLITIALFYLMQIFYKDEVLTLLPVIITISSGVFIELLVAVKYDFHGQRNTRQGGQCFSCKQCLYSIHVLALWNILIAVQLVTMIATPICVLLFIHHRVLILLGQPFLQAIADYVS